MENQIPDIEITDSELSDTDSELSDTEIVSEIPKTIEEMVSSVLYYCTNSAFTSRFILECNRIPYRFPLDFWRIPFRFRKL